MERVAIVGVGLIGGSFGLALRKAGFTGELLGVSSPPAIRAGLKTGAISRSGTLEEAAATADLIYLSQPIDRILKTLEELGPLARPETLITDAGSTKAAIVRKASECLRESSFLGGHPMAGKEQSGAEFADSNLFKDRPYVLTPTTADIGATGEEFRCWLVRIEAKVVEMQPAEHDSVVARTSHLPQLISTALAVALASEGTEKAPEVFGPALLDMTRLALSPPEVWMSILATNRREVTGAMDAFIASLVQIRDTLATGDVRPFFEAANGFARTIRNRVE